MSAQSTTSRKPAARKTTTAPHPFLTATCWLLVGIGVNAIHLDSAAVHAVQAEIAAHHASAPALPTLPTGASAAAAGSTR